MVNGRTMGNGPKVITVCVYRQDNSAYHHLGTSGVGNDGFLNGQHSNDPSLDKLQGTYIYLPSIHITNSLYCKMSLKKCLYISISNHNYGKVENDGLIISITTGNYF